MSILLDGKKLSEYLYTNLNNYLADKKKPHIVDISIGDDFGSQMYAKLKKKKLEEILGYTFDAMCYDTISVSELEDVIKGLNKDPNIDGIMIQLPLSKPLRDSEREILDLIDVNKDVDGLTSKGMGLLVTGKPNLVPCTPLGIISMLHAYHIAIEGKTCTIVNRSNIVGKPMEQLMLQNNATTTMCHSKTVDLKSSTTAADILIVACNKQELITADYVKDGAIVIDIGVHKNELGKTVGDVKTDEVSNKASYISAPTGGVGPMTICMLAYNSAKTLYGSAIDELLSDSLKDYHI